MVAPHHQGSYGVVGVGMWVSPGSPRDETAVRVYPQVAVGVRQAFKNTAGSNKTAQLI